MSRLGGAACLIALGVALAGCSANTSDPSTQRTVLLAPDLIAAAARGATDDPQAKWLLGQPRDVRTSYVHDVIDAKGDKDLLSQKWLLGQSDGVRASYVSDVLQPQLSP
jgi:hypothetical protein